MMAYKIKAIGLEDSYVEGVNAEEITDQLYSEDIAWKKARNLVRAINRSDTHAEVFVTRCEAEVTEQYDVPVMDPSR